MLTDRTEAGDILAQILCQMTFVNPLVLAIPRGGVVVGYPVAQALKAELDIIIPRKIGAPYNPEVAVGAIAPDGTAFFNQDLLRFLHLDESSLEPIIQREMKEIERRMRIYRGSAKSPLINGRSVVLVDDGLATGYTVQAALQGLREQNPAQLILAVPVAPPDTLGRLRSLVDEIVCLLIPDDFQAVGQFYDNFNQTTDEEVMKLLGKQS